MADELLHHEVMTDSGVEPERWIYALHGIFGAGRNWASLMRRMIRERPEWGVVLVDLREHGGSRGFAPPHTLAAAASDLQRLVERSGRRSDAVLGHSFGGKVALEYARQVGEGGVDQVWVVDSTPEATPPGGSAATMIRVVRRHPGPFATRDELIQALVGEGVAIGTAQWMATNLEPAAGGYRWRLDFDALEELLSDFFRTDLWDVVEARTGPRLFFLRAGTGSVLSDAAAARIEAAGSANGRVTLHTVAGGHWLNADNPEAVARLLIESLQ